MSSINLPSFPMMVGTVRWCKLIGLWDGTGSARYHPRTLTLLLALIFWYILPTCMFVLRRQDRPLTLVMKAVHEVMAMTAFVLRISAHALSRSTLEKCFYEVQGALDEFARNGQLSEDMRKHLERADVVLARYYIPGNLFGIFLYGGLPGVLAIGRFVFTGYAEELPATVLEADYVLFDHQSNFWIWLPTLIVSVAVQYGMIIGITANETFCWNLIHHVSCLFKIVSARVARLDEFEEEEAYQQELEAILETHLVCYRSVCYLEKALYLQMAVLYSACVAVTCFVLFVVSIVDDLFLLAMMAFVLNYHVFLIFSFSVLGSELMDASTSVAEAIYNIKWYNRSISEQRCLQFMIYRSQNAIFITAGKFFKLTRATFMVAMKTAFSYFTIMQQLYAEE
ncbi:odorant receptor 94a [Culex quinquefasciatus]|uniref:odorant receptor 94a n=1 Tax=Culex quinquefasciatus TaxID=7176 RepID=UPI0018E342CF|nr:odorant receptor 94a [Culex quinquefasciatus]